MNRGRSPLASAIAIAGTVCRLAHSSRLPSVVVVLVCIALALTARADDATVQLKDGRQVTGAVLDNAPGHHVTLVGPNGAPVRFERSEIARVTLHAQGEAAAQPPATPAGSSVSDAVLLVDGQVVQGTLVQRSMRGVALQLPDGSLKSFPFALVAYAGKVGTGGLRITTTAPAHIRVDGALVGRAPLDVHDLPSKPEGYWVRADFDDGRTSKEHALVQAGHVTPLRLGPMAAAKRVDYRVRVTARARNLSAARRREGLHLFVAGGGYVDVLLDPENIGGGGQLAGGVNFGARPRLDLRLVVLLNIGAFSRGTEYVGFELAARPSLRLNLGANYSMELGVRLGVYRHAPVVALSLGPELSLLSFRLGRDRAYELTIWQALPVHFVRYDKVASTWYDPPSSVELYFQAGISLGHLFL